MRGHEIPFSAGEGIVNVSPHPRFNNSLFETLRLHYAGLNLTSDSRGTKIEIFTLPPPARTDFLMDLAFFCKNPDTPLENVCSRLDNYQPKNGSQRELLRWAHTLLDLKEPSASAGIWMHGDPGVGKTHISIALAKEYMKTGSATSYINVSSNLAPSHISADNPATVWVIDDLNNPYGLGSGFFEQVIYRVHNNGGRIFVASNMDFAEFFRKLGSIKSEPEMQRITDRVKSMFKVVPIQGESHRQEKKWYDQ